MLHTGEAVGKMNKAKGVQVKMIAEKRAWPIVHCHLLLIFTAALHAQSPFIYYRGVVNVASYMPPGLPSGGIAQGGQFSIFGSNLGPATSPTLAFPLATTLAGVSISVTQGATTVAAIPVFLSPGQINAIMPSNTPLGQASLRVTYNNFKSNLVPVNIVASSFGIFSSTGTGQGPGSIQNYSATGLPLNGLNAPASIGQLEILYGVGLGAALGPDNMQPVSGNLPTQVEVFVGGVSATVLYSGRASCCSGIDQINFMIPSGAPSGCWVPVAVRTQGTIVSNTVTMAVGAGSSCTEPNNPLATALISGGRQASLFAARISTRHDVNVVAALEAMSDYAAGTLFQQQSGAYNFNPYVSLPPAGSCTTYSVSSYSPSEVPLFTGLTPTGKALNAGTLSIAGSSGAPLAIPTNLVPGYAAGYLGGAVPLISQLPATLFLNPGAFTMAAQGGTDIPAFSVPFTMPAPFTWTNRDSLNSVTRSQPLTVSWTGVASGATVFVAGGGADIPNSASTAFVCLAHPGDLTLTVPPLVLANVPAQHTRASQSLGVIYVGEMPLTSPTVFTAGTASGQLLPAQVLGKSVSFQ
ncbi:MAG TPA: hypothetical protein VK752_08360 [Bryobacteraceae bacterium]|jgi:uncharacterized protein (TIGR03437 family)|nr:hypothetical protein [Bryobacteraceae bacterium]